MLCCKKKCCKSNQKDKKAKKPSKGQKKLVRKLIYAGAFALLLFIIEKAAEKLNKD